jgi:hypothetical protein
MFILEQDSEDDNDDDGWQELYSLMRVKPLWQFSTPHIHIILTVSNIRQGMGSGRLNYMYQTQLILKLILSATGPPTSLEGRDDHEMYYDKQAKQSLL